jgi:hypothetical protein
MRNDKLCLCCVHPPAERLASPMPLSTGRRLEVIRILKLFAAIHNRDSKLDEVCEETLEE